jgi:hypothetical protein
MSDIEFEKRRIEIQKSKTDHVSKYQGRTIVLPCIAELFLSRLAVSLLKDTFDINGRVFPMTKGAFKQSWADVRKREFTAVLSSQSTAAHINIPVPIAIIK